MRLKRLVLLSVLAGCQAAPGSETSPVEGTWRLVGSGGMSAEGEGWVGAVQESFLLFAGHNFSMGWTSGAEPSPYYEQRFRPTGEEFVARYQRLVANSGTFTWNDSLLTMRPEWALVAEFVGGESRFTYRLDGDTLTLRWIGITSADGIDDPFTAAGGYYEYEWLRRD